MYGPSAYGPCLRNNNLTSVNRELRWSPQQRRPNRIAHGDVNGADEGGVVHWGNLLCHAYATRVISSKSVDDGSATRVSHRGDIS